MFSTNFKKISAVLVIINLKIILKKSKMAARMATCCETTVVLKFSIWLTQA